MECAAEYNRQGADELVFYDINASHEGRGVILDVVRRAAQQVFVPLTVGGGISTIDDFRETLRAGADKVSINSSSVKNPKLIAEAADISAVSVWWWAWMQSGTAPAATQCM